MEPKHIQPPIMPVTFTIKQVPDELASLLRRRAEANRRSLQRELLQIIESAAREGAREPTAAYNIKPAQRRAAHDHSGKAAASRLSLEELWARARRLSSPMPSESAAIVRDDRDARQRR